MPEVHIHYIASAMNIFENIRKKYKDIKVGKNLVGKRKKSANVGRDKSG